ncbi:allophanate hydrolase-related protein [Amycolatopsis jejuensis]|uniref:allophanate hydrolase-related protein n=1 Tax=Amycolatopsis jejuensis TaxID=330084 RepID=UPI0005261994|nr:amidase family protein [Amycolatopsis jejuensis]
MTTLPPEPEPIPLPPPSAHERVRTAFERIAKADRPELWAALRTMEEVLVEAKAVDEHVHAGENLPLAGIVYAVDGCFDAQATAVARLTGAGAVVLGTTAADPEITVVEAFADLALSTSARELTAPSGVVGLKPTKGLIPRTGVRLDAADCISVFAHSLTIGQRAVAAMIGPDGADPDVRAWPADLRLAAGNRPRLGIPAKTRLPLPARRVLDVAAASLEASGAVLVPSSGLTLGALDALLLPTSGIRETALNVLDLAAVTVSGERRPYGITVVTRAFEDQIGIDLATVLTGEQAPEPYSAEVVDVVVFGAHLCGQPLHSELRGARFGGLVRTAERYRLVLLENVTPVQPGVIPGSAGIDGERWQLSPAALGRFTAGLPAPFVLGRVELEDGSTPLAVLCEPAAAAGGEGLDRYASWRGYLRFVSTAGPRFPG